MTTATQPQETVQLPAHLQTGIAPDLPTGGEFGRGYIAEITTNVCYMLYSEHDLGQIEYMSKRQMGNGHRYYFATKEHGMQGIEAAGLKWKSPPRAFVIGFSGADVINYRSDDPEQESSFRQSDKISEIDLVTLASKKKHAFAPMQLIALPSMVYAMATMLQGTQAPNFVQPDGQPINLFDETLEPLFSVDNLLGNDWILNDETQAKLVGNSDIGYKGSRLWQAREALWLALGEEDARKWLRIGTQTSKGKRASGTTDSPLLSACLGALASWKGYARVAWCTDPRVGEMYKNPKWSAETTDQPEMLSRRFLIISDMYTDRAAAELAVIDELGELPVPGVVIAGGAPVQQPAAVATPTQQVVAPQAALAPVATGAVSQPAIPTIWASIPTDFMSQARATFASESDNTAASKTLSISLPETIAWRNFLSGSQPTG